MFVPIRMSIAMLVFATPMLIFVILGTGLLECWRSYCCLHSLVTASYCGSGRTTNRRTDDCAILAPDLLSDDRTGCSADCATYHCTGIHG